jgi:hypothetical protein
VLQELTDSDVAFRSFLHRPAAVRPPR